jgi:phosphoribosylaminoimidazole (AIR) synthetase
MGVGMLLVIAQRDLKAVTAALRKRHEQHWVIGRIVRGRPSVKYVST